MKTTDARRLRLAVAGLAAAGLLSSCGLSLQDAPKPGGYNGSTYSLTATFSDVLNLPVDAQIREGARVIGQVSSMHVVDYRAQVVLHIDRAVRVPVGSTVEVRFDNPLGDQYIELRPAGGATTFLAAGDRIGLADTAAAPTVEDTLGAFATVLTGGGVGNIQTISHELNQMFAGNQPQIRQLLDRLNRSATTLAGGLGPIDNALTAVASLTTRLNSSSGTLVKGLQQIAPAIRLLAEQNGQFNTLLRGLDDFAVQGNAVIRSSGAQTVQALQALVPVVNEIVASADHIGPVLDNVRVLAQQIPNATRGGYLHVNMLAEFDLSSAPNAPSSAGAHALNTVGGLMTPLGAVTAPGGAR